MKAKKNELKNLPKYFMKHIKNRVMKKLEDE